MSGGERDPSSDEEEPTADSAPSEADSQNDAEEGEEHQEADDAGEGDEEAPSTQAELERRREENVRALVSGTLHLSRRALMPRLLTVANAEAAVLRRAFKSPHPTAPAVSDVSAPPPSHPRTHPLPPPALAAPHQASFHT